MATLTIKNMPKALHAQLVAQAAVHRRSLNNELIACLESVLAPHAVDIDALIASARQLRAGMEPVDHELIDVDKRSGRP